MSNNLNIKNYVTVTLVLLVFSIISIKVSSTFHSNIKKIQTVRSEWKVEKQRTGTVVGKMTEEFKDGTVKKTAFVRVEGRLVPIAGNKLSRDFRIGDTIKTSLTNGEIYKKDYTKLVNDHLVYCITCMLVFLPLFLAIVMIFKQTVKNLNEDDCMWKRFVIKLPLFVSIISATIVFALSIYSIIKFG